MNQQTPDAQNPELGLGDAFKLLQAIAEAVLTGATEVPVISMKIAGKRVRIGPIPISIA